MSGHFRREPTNVTWSQENDDLHGDVLVVVHLQPTQLVRKVEHLLDPLLDPELPTRFRGQDPVVGDPDDPGRADGAVAAAEDEQLAPGVDQERNLVVDL